MSNCDKHDWRRANVKKCPNELAGYIFQVCLNCSAVRGAKIEYEYGDYMSSDDLEWKSIEECRQEVAKQKAALAKWMAEQTMINSILEQALARPQANKEVSVWLRIRKRNSTSLGS